MAKKTRDSNLSVEERLEQALIPNWDVPYKLPSNWCWVKFLCCSNIKTGKKDANYGSDNGEYPFFTCAADPIRCNGYSFDCHAILLAGNGDIGNISIYDGKFEAYQRTYVVETVGDIDTRYAYYYFKYKWEDYNKDKMFGSAIPYIRLGNLQDFPFPIAPMLEQERIVQQIESLFAQLDEAKEKAQEVVDGFETRKAAILHKAFSGELTAKWREENGINNCSYAKKRFDEVAIIKSNLVDPSEYQDYPHIAPDNIEKKTGILLEYHTIAEDGVKSGKHRFYPGQILYSKIRPNLSKVVVVDFDGLCSADMYPIEAFGDTKCLWYFMLSENFLEQASSAGSRSVLPKINQKELSALTVTIPESIDEQKQLSRIIDSLFVKEYQVKESAEAVIEQIDTIKKAILARAFRGELGTNDPSEESAVELLKQVLNTVVEPKKSIKRTTIPKALDNRIKTDLERKIIKLYFQNEVDVLSIDLIMGVSSKKFEIMEALRNLQQRGLLEKQNDKYKLLG